jgi:hypothetical protein
MPFIARLGGSWNFCDRRYQGSSAGLPGRPALRGALLQGLRNHAAKMADNVPSVPGFARFSAVFPGSYENKLDPVPFRHCIKSFHAFFMLNQASLP